MAVEGRVIPVGIRSAFGPGQDRSDRFTFMAQRLGRVAEWQTLGP